MLPVSGKARPVRVHCGMATRKCVLLSWCAIYPWHMAECIHWIFVYTWCHFMQNNKWKFYKCTEHDFRYMVKRHLSFYTIKKYINFKNVIHSYLISQNWYTLGHTWTGHIHKMIPAYCFSMLWFRCTLCALVWLCIHPWTYLTDVFSDFIWQCSIFHRKLFCTCCLQICFDSSPPDKMATISQKVFSDAFLWMKFHIMVEISMKFVPNGPIDNNQALVGIIWTNADQIHWFIYEALGGDALSMFLLCNIE